MKRKFVKFGLLLLVGFVVLINIPVQAAAPITQIQAMLKKPEVLCGRFEQTKELVGISKPLQSSGRFCVIANKGILWRTLQPFPNTLRLTRDEILQTQGNRTAMRLDAKQEPVVRTINSVLFSLLAGDLTQLQQLFDINGTIVQNHWQVTLKARNAALANAIGNIKLQGDNYVQQVTITAANGDRTHIAFFDINSGKAAISKDEGNF